MSRIVTAGILLSLCLLCSCATIALDSSTIKDHEVLMNDDMERPYDVISDFKINDKGGWIIGIIPVNKPAGDNHDYLASLLQSQIDKAGGDAVINVKLRGQNSVGDILINVVTLGIYVPRTLTVTGQVIKYREQ